MPEDSLIIVIFSELTIELLMIVPA